MIYKIFERDDFSVSDTGCSEEKIRVLSIEDEPMMIFQSVTRAAQKKKSVYSP